MQNQQEHASATQIDKKKDILISIALTESTSSLLQLDLPQAEELDTQNIELSIQAAKSSNKETSNKAFNTSRGGNFTNYWFGEENIMTKKSECKQVSQEVAYFSDNPTVDESVSSFDFDPVGPKQTSSVTLLNDRLKGTTVYTRPLVTVKSLSESKNKISSKDILTSFRDSKEHIHESEWSNVCRICHGGESNGCLVSPCDCRGSIAMAHLECLERWLKESSNSQCELCKHQYVVIREPKYSVPKSVYLFLRHPGENLAELLFDLFTFVIYTPAAVVSTYMLVLLCESVAKSHLQYNRNLSSHVITLSAVLGMAAIDFTYSSWLMVNLQKHYIAWRHWYRNNSKIRIILPEEKETNTVNSSEDEVD